jgi:hypothetical protein
MQEYQLVYSEKARSAAYRPGCSQNGFAKPLDGLQRPHRIAVEVIAEPKIKLLACYHNCGVTHDGSE